MRKGVYPYEYIDEWEIFHETLLPHHPPPPPLPKKKEFYINLNMEDITGLDQNHAKKNL